MADKKLVIGIGVDTSGLDTETKAAANSISKFADVSKMNIGALQTAINDLEEADWSIMSDAEIADAKKKSGELRKAYRELDETLDSMSKTTFQNVAEGFSQMISMASGMSAAYTMIGGDQKEMEALMQKTVALMAVAQGAQEAALFFNQHAYGVFIKNKAKEIAAWITETLTINSASASAAAFNKVIASNPVGLIIVAVAALAAGVYILATSMDVAGRKAEQLKTEIDAMNQAMDDAKAWGDFAGQLDSIFDVDRKGQNAVKRLNEYRESLQAIQAKLAESIRLQGVDVDPADKQRYEALSKEIIAVGDQIILAKASQKKKDLDSEKANNAKLAEEAKKAAEKAAAERKARIAKQLDEARADFAGWMAMYDRDVENHLMSEKDRATRVLKLRRELVTQLDAIEKGHTKVVKGQIDITTDPLFDPTKPLVGIQSKPFELPVMVKLEPLPIDPIKVEMLEVDVSGAMAGVIEQVSGAIGEAAVTGDWSNFGSTILNGIAGFMQQVGAMFIAFGIAKQAFETGVHPAVLIAAGVAMVAIGAGIKAATSKSATKAAASGGSAAGGGAAGGWDVSMAQASWGDRGSDVRFVIEGSQLVGVLGNESNRKTTY